jgi:hypothetical protein
MSSTTAPVVVVIVSARLNESRHHCHQRIVAVLTGPLPDGAVLTDSEISSPVRPCRCARESQKANRLKRFRILTYSGGPFHDGEGFLRVASSSH